MITLFSFYQGDTFCLHYIGEDKVKKQLKKLLELPIICFPVKAKYAFCILDHAEIFLSKIMIQNIRNKMISASTTTLMYDF